MRFHVLYPYNVVNPFPWLYCVGWPTVNPIIEYRVSLIEKKSSLS